MPERPRLALYHPDIPQNVGSIIRLSACMAAELHIIEPCGFPFDDKRMKRASLDYYDHARLTRHSSWEAFLIWRETLSVKPRLVLFTTRGATPIGDFTFQPGDILLFGQESSGAPKEVHDAADARVVIPINPETRSLNVALAASMALGLAIAQTS